MKINVCVPTRGKQEFLLKYLPMSIKNSALEDTRFVVGFDSDDPTWKECVEAMQKWPEHLRRKVIVSEEPREDSLGAKYNRCAAVYDADVYVISMDDVGIVTKGWDEMLSSPASQCRGVGLFGMGKDGNEPYPSMIAATKGFVELMGGKLVNPYFPGYWWCNTWLDEIGHMTGRYALLPDIETKYPERMPATYKNHLAFWAWFFDITRLLRAGIAQSIIEAVGTPLENKRHLVNIRPDLFKEFEGRNAALRDPVRAKSILHLDNPGTLYVPEVNPAFDDERHQRLIMQALRVVESMAV